MVSVQTPAEAKLALLGGKPVRSSSFTPWPLYDAREIELVTEVVKSRSWGGYPYPNVKAREFAQKFARFQGTEYGVCLSHGSTSLEVALKAAGIEAGDEVIVPAITWMGTCGPVIFVNAIPIIVDILPETYCIDPDRIEQAIGPKTKAIMPVHLGSKMADMDRIMDIANDHNLIVIEDCAHAHGASWGDKPMGSIGDLGCFSFYESKVMTSGEGGIIITNDKKLAEKCESYINASRLGEKENNKYAVLGYNYRMTEFQAAILLAQLERLPEQAARRRENVIYFEERLRKIDGVELLENQDKAGGPRVGFMYVFKYKTEKFGGLPRKKFLEAMGAEGVTCYGNWYPPLYKNDLLPLTKDSTFWGDTSRKEYYANLSCPVAEKAAFEEDIWMVHQMFLGDKKDMDSIADAISKIRNNTKELLES